MKRILGSLAAFAVVAAALGQANFTIVRPEDGAHVREKVHILFPKGSIPSSGYVGIFLDGQLIDALVPTPGKKFDEYVLDTKARGIADSKPGKPYKLEAKLFVDYNDEPRITKVSSIDVYVGNEANIKVPDSGIKLRYDFVRDTAMIYDLQQRVAVDTISESENALGGKAAELPLDSETLRLLYSVDNTFGDGSGLLRMQAIPYKGKDYAVLTTIQDPEPKVYYKDDMASIYMRVNPLGHEVFGSVPLYFGFFGMTGAADPLELYADFPLPTLPLKAVRPGDSWAGRFQEGIFDPNNIWDATTLVKTYPGRGEFAGVEWEMGHPCAKIMNSIAASEMSDEDRKLMQKGASFGGEKVKREDTIWFALDTHKIVKMVNDTTIETKVSGAAMGGPGMGGPMGGGKGGGMAPGSRGGDERTIPLFQKGRGFGPAGAGGPGGAMGPGGRGPGGMAPGGGGFGAGGGAPAQNQFVRIHMQQVFTLEQ